MSEESLRYALQTDRGTWRRAPGVVQSAFLQRAFARKFTHQAQALDAWDWFIAGYNTPCD